MGLGDRFTWKGPMRWIGDLCLVDPCASESLVGPPHYTALIKFEPRTGDWVRGVVVGRLIGKRNGKHLWRIRAQ